MKPSFIIEGLCLERFAFDYRTIAVSSDCQIFFCVAQKIFKHLSALTVMIHQTHDVITSDARFYRIQIYNHQWG